MTEALDDRYVIVQVKDNQDAFTAKVNELLAMEYSLNGDLKVIQQADHLLYIQGLFYEEEEEGYEYEEGLEEDEEEVYFAIDEEADGLVTE